MRFAIRLLIVATLIIFVVAIGAAQHGELAQATELSYQWPGLFEALILVALLALTLLLFTISSIVGLVLAIRSKERPWAIAMALGVMGITLIYLGLFLSDGFLLPVVRYFPPNRGLWGFLQVFIPALLGSALLTIYSFRTRSDPRPPLYMRLSG
jgi:hypothetical protein